MHTLCLSIMLLSQSSITCTCIVLQLPYLQFSNYVVQIHTYILQRETLAECNVPNCFIRCVLPCLMWISPYFGKLIGKIAVLANATGSLIHVQWTISSMGAPRVLSVVVRAWKPDLLLFAGTPWTKFSRHHCWTRQCMRWIQLPAQWPDDLAWLPTRRLRWFCFVYVRSPYRMRSYMYFSW